ncbi:hypothetical protein RMATCC62417_11606 [Rhizopus microsporus]|nr:hypothetical protein RMATCC62417_11606 [Rhizopus microsporus]
MTSYLTSTTQLPLKKPFEEKKKMVNAWELIQKKTFTKWVNNKLDVKNIPNIVHLNEDLANGVRLIQLLEIIGGESLRPYNQHPTMIFQKMENVNKALDFIKSRGVALTNIGAEDIVNKNLKLVLGMLWTIILRFTIADINQDGKNAKEGLLLWCQRKTASYEEVDVQDFTYSWTDGLALCALIHHHHPELIDWDALDKTDRHGNTALAFEIAEKNFNIPKLLDVEDLCDISKPDERSVMTYVAEYFHAFSALDEFETAGRRVAKFADVLASVWEMKHHYEERVIALMEAVDLMQEEWESTELTDSYIDAKEKSTNFAIYKSTQKRAWLAEKRDIDALLGNIQTKAKTYNLRPYYPPNGLTLKDLDDCWNRLLQNEARYHRRINSTIRQIKEGLRKAFAEAANDFQEQLDTISAKLVNLEGSLQSQLKMMKVGDRIGVRGPKGAFIYSPNMVKEIGMVAGGTGITPMLQIIKAILRNPADKTKISLIFGNVTKPDILLEEELQGLVEQHPDRFSVYHVLNEPPENWNQGVGFITKDILEQRLPKPSNDVKILVCGPPPMVKAVTNVNGLNMNYTCIHSYIGYNGFRI